MVPTDLYRPDPWAAVARATWSPADRLRSVTARPIRADDAARLGRLFRRLSRETVVKRFFTAVTDPSGKVLAHLATVDHHDREAFVAVVGDDVVGVARYERSARDRRVAEAAVVVEDAWQRRGIGRFLLRRLGDAAVAAGIERFTASALATNQAPVLLARALAPLVEVALDGGEVALVIPLSPASAPATADAGAAGPAAAGAAWSLAPGEGHRYGARTRRITPM